MEKLIEVRATKPNYDGDYIEKGTTYIKFTSEVLNEMKELEFFKKNLAFSRELDNIITQVDGLYYKGIEMTLNVNN